MYVSKILKESFFFQNIWSRSISVLRNIMPVKTLLEVTQLTLSMTCRKVRLLTKSVQMNSGYMSKLNQCSLSVPGPPNARKKRPVFPQAGRSQGCAFARWRMVFTSCLDNTSDHLFRCLNLLDP